MAKKKDTPVQFFKLNKIELRHAWELLIAMTEREIKARYKHALLGFLWIILNPILQMVVIGSVFSFVFKVPVADYFLFLFTGLLVWNFFSLTLTKVTPSVVFELNLIEKAKFPRSIIVLSIILSNLFHLLVAVVLLFVFLLFVGKLHWQTFIFFPLPLLWITGVAVGLGLITSALNVKYRDVNFFVQAIVPLWFYATPIMYDQTLVPERLKILMYFNPLFSSIQIFRWAFIGGAFPAQDTIIANGVISLLLLLIGIIVFRHESPFFDDWT